MAQRYPHQEQNDQENPAMLDYEKMLGHSPLNFAIYDDSLRATDPGVRKMKPDAKTEMPETRATEPGEAAPDNEVLHDPAAPDAPRPKKKHATQRQIQERLAVVRNHLLERTSPTRIDRRTGTT
jgi:hypothetical protein